MALFGTVYTVNNTDKRVWITIYDLGKTQHLDYGWVDPKSSRAWASGNYMYGSFYHVRGEVKSDAAGHDPNVYDTSIQINIQSGDHTRRMQVLDSVTGKPIFDQQVETGGGVVTILQGNGNYYWSDQVVLP